jgi:hypothetical protein
MWSTPESEIPTPLMQHTEPKDALEELREFFKGKGTVKNLFSYNYSSYLNSNVAYLFAHSLQK